MATFGIKTKRYRVISFTNLVFFSRKHLNRYRNRWPILNKFCLSFSLQSPGGKSCCVLLTLLTVMLMRLLTLSFIIIMRGYKTSTQSWQHGFLRYAITLQLHVLVCWCASNVPPNNCHHFMCLCFLVVHFQN